MSDALHSSLPIEYKLQYGTACGNLNGLDSMSNSVFNSLSGIPSGLAQENLFGTLRINSRPLVVNSLDALVIGLNRGESLL